MSGWGLLLNQFLTHRNKLMGHWAHIKLHCRLHLVRGPLNQWGRHIPTETLWMTTGGRHLFVSLMALFKAQLNWALCKTFVKHCKNSHDELDAFFIILFCSCMHLNCTEKVLSIEISSKYTYSNKYLSFKKNKCFTIIEASILQLYKNIYSCALVSSEIISLILSMSMNSISLKS